MNAVVQKTRRALAVVFVGLVVELFTILFWSPLMFVLFASVGAGLVALGGLFLVVSLWPSLRQNPHAAVIADDEADR